MAFRSTQSRTRLFTESMARGHRGDRLVLDIVPGGGKTGCAAIAADTLLRLGAIKKVLIVVPRLSLAAQMCDGFVSPSYETEGRAVCHVADNRPPVYRLFNCGAVTTYQAVHSNPDIYLSAVREHDSLVVFDEIQFLAETERQSWTRSIAPVYEAAKYRLLMSGTLWRTDGCRIPFIDYTDPDDQGLRYPKADITYGVREAVRERAILPMEWVLSGGWVRYEHNGDCRDEDLSAVTTGEESRALRTFIERDQTALGIIDRCVDDWKRWCRDVYQTRMIVVADRQKRAKQYRDYIEKTHGVPCVLAISDELGSTRALARFRRRQQGQCLVTVGMAYVGFDCPDLSHMAYLSHIRAPGNMLQAHSRVNRVHHDAPVAWEKQIGKVFAPDDPLMRAYCDRVRDAIATGLRERRAAASADQPPGAGGPPPETFTPLDSEMGGTALETLAGRVEPANYRELQEFMEACPSARGIAPSVLKDIIESARRGRSA